jgi:acetylornithine/N-succinyldiaminopimelate aminotransferase
LLERSKTIGAVIQGGSGGRFITDAERGGVYHDMCCGTGCTGIQDGNLNARIISKFPAVPHNTYNYPTVWRQEAEAELEATYPGYDFAFFSGGAECTEAALRCAAALLGEDLGAETHAFKGCFHGKTWWTGILGGAHMSPEYNQPITLRQPGIVIFEPMQTRNGVRVATHDFLRNLQYETNRTESIAIADEISTTIRSGHRLLTHELGGNWTPHIICVGKNIGQGFPVAVVGVRQDLCNKLLRRGVSLTSGFGGNPWACIAVKETLQYVRETKLLAHIQDSSQAMHKVLADTLRNNPAVEEVTGVGMWFGVRFVNEKVRDQVVSRLLVNRYIVSPCGVSSIRMSPPFSLGLNDWIDFCEAV